MNIVKLEIYLPEHCLKDIIINLSQIGVGRVGKYTHVSSYARVSGTWMPEDGSKPYDGNINELSYGEEYKLEMRCPFEKVNKAVQIIKEFHPYEEPVINILPLLNEEFNMD